MINFKTFIFKLFVLLFIYSCSKKCEKQVKYTQYGDRLEYCIDKNGLKQGKLVKYHKDNSIDTEMNFVNDTLDGYFISYFSYGGKSFTFYEKGEKNIQFQLMQKEIL